MSFWTFMIAYALFTVLDCWAFSATPYEKRPQCLRYWPGSGLYGFARHALNRGESR